MDNNKPDIIKFLGIPVHRNRIFTIIFISHIGIDCMIKQNTNFSVDSFKNTRIVSSERLHLNPNIFP